MKTVRPQPLGKPVDGAPLTPEEGFLLARIDGRLSVGDLVALTGIDGRRVDQIVKGLAQRGVVALLTDNVEESDTASLSDFAAALGVGAIEQPVTLSRTAARAAPPPAVDQLIEVPDDETAPLADATTADEDAAADASADADAEEEARAEKEQDYRKIYESRFHVLTIDVRVGLAKVAHGADLLALCLDADTRVVAAILENPTIGLAHVRLIAFHHRTGTGLEMISRRTELLRDLLVERRLLRNPMSGETVLGRIFASKRLFQTYKIAIDRDVPEMTRIKGRGHLRQKWGKAAAEERADLVLRTEGRCLILMTGCTFDARSTQIMCSKTYNSILFIQNLAKFPATPPALLAHLHKQPFVRKIAPLKKLLLQHPNMPGDVKRHG